MYPRFTSSSLANYFINSKVFSQMTSLSLLSLKLRLCCDYPLRGSRFVRLLWSVDVYWMCPLGVALLICIARLGLGMMRGSLHSEAEKPRNYHHQKKKFNLRAMAWEKCSLTSNLIYPLLESSRRCISLSETEHHHYDRHPDKASEFPSNLVCWKSNSPFACSYNRSTLIFEELVQKVSCLFCKA